MHACCAHVLYMHAHTCQCAHIIRIFVRVPLFLFLLVSLPFPVLACISVTASVCICVRHSVRERERRTRKAFVCVDVHIYSNLFKSTPLLSHFSVLSTNTYMHVVQMLDACKLIRSHVHASAHTLCFSLSLSLPVFLFLSVVQERDIERCRQKQSVLVFASTRSCIHTDSFSITLEYQLCVLLCVCWAACV